MECARCHGLMVTETVYHACDKVAQSRCLNCGAIVDPLIRENKMHSALQPVQAQSFSPSEFNGSLDEEVMDQDHGFDGECESFLKILPLVDVIGPHCDSKSAGGKVNDLVQNWLDEGYSVQLDFRGVKLITPAFYRAAIGDLYCSFPEDLVEARVSIRGLSDLKKPCAEVVKRCEKLIRA